MTARLLARIACALAWTIPTVALAQVNSSEFERELMHVTLPLHLELGSPLNASRDTLESEGFTLAPRSLVRSKVLRQPVYDVSGWFRKRGAILPKGSHALFSPKSELIFINAAAEDVEIARRALQPDEKAPDFKYTFDLQVYLQPKKGRKTILAVKSAPLVLEHQVVFSAKGEPAVRFLLDPEVSRDSMFIPDWILRMGTQATVTYPDTAVTMTGAWNLDFGRPTELTVEVPGHPAVVFQLRADRIEVMRGPSLLTTPAKKSAAMKEIQGSLKRVAR